MEVTVAQMQDVLQTMQHQAVLMVRVLDHLGGLETQALRTITHIERHLRTIAIASMITANPGVDEVAEALHTIQHLPQGE